MPPSPGATCELCSVSACRATSPDVAFKAANLIKKKETLAITGYVFWRKGKRVCVSGGGQMRGERRVKRLSALHLFVATGSCTAQEKCAYIITCGPGILQRAVLIAETQSGRRQPTSPGETRQGAPTQLGFLTFLAAFQRGQS